MLGTVASSSSRGLIRKLGNAATRCQTRFPLVATCARTNSGGSSSAPPPPPPPSNAGAAAASSVKYAKTTAGTGDPEGSGETGFSTRGPVTWPALGLVAIAAASAVSYYKIERERRLENAMGKIVSDLGFMASKLFIVLFCVYFSSNYHLFISPPQLKVSSESGWSPNPELLARRQYVRTKWGWFPKEDAFGGGEFLLSLTTPNPVHHRMLIFYIAI